MYNNIFDSHAHYDDEKFDEDRDSLLASLPDSGISAVISCGVDIESSKFNIELAEKYEYIYSAVGFHPLNLESLSPNYIDDIRSLAAHPKVVAIGEIGLDYHYEKESRLLQLEVLRNQILLANELSLPVIIHDRESHVDILNILKELKPRGVVHCFSGSPEMAKDILKIGMYIGLGGSVTFKNAVKPKEVAKILPEDKILLETDCPYMAPIPFRGQRNDSSLIPYVAEEIATIRGCNAEDILKISDKNARTLFAI